MSCFTIWIRAPWNHPKPRRGIPDIRKKRCSARLSWWNARAFRGSATYCDYLENNKLIAHYCGFDITKPLPSYWTYVRFLKNLDNGFLKQVMERQVLHLAKLGIVDASLLAIALATIITQAKPSYRCIKSVKRIAWVSQMNSQHTFRSRIICCAFFSFAPTLLSVGTLLSPLCSIGFAHPSVHLSQNVYSKICFR